MQGHALFVHGTHELDSLPFYDRLAAALLRVDLELSPVAAVDCDSVRDVACDRPTRLLIGYGDGGAAALDAAASLESASAVVLIDAPFAPDGDALRAEARLGELGRPLLVSYSADEPDASADDALAMFAAASQPKSLITLGADPEIISAWARRYAVRDIAAEGEAELAEREVLVRGGARGFANLVLAGSHRLAADEPRDVGGTDTGPDPYAYLLAALGACTSMTLRMYADRKGWPLEGVDVRVRHERVYAKDCADCETQSGRIDTLYRVVDPRGPLDDEQRARLLEIADKCPVHKTLTREIKVRSELAPRSR